MLTVQTWPYISLDTFQITHRGIVRNADEVIVAVSVAAFAHRALAYRAAQDARHDMIVCGNYGCQAEQVEAAFAAIEAALLAD